VRTRWATPREPVPHRPGPHGARHQGKDVGVSGNVHRMPHDLVNAKPVMAAIREFFGSSQLSQFMIRPIRSVKSPTSAACPLSVRAGCRASAPDSRSATVHPTHYGRICPIETPEGPNIGLIQFAFVLRADQRVRLHPNRPTQGQGRACHRITPLIRHAGESEFKAGEIVERRQVERSNEELKRPPRSLRPYCFYLSHGGGPLRRRAG